jgi:ADP-ribose pyrophosphatase
MEVNNPLYKNQGVHVISSIFTVEKGVAKILLIRRKKEPFKNMWALVGGALYNNEDLESGMNREILEKTGVDEVELYLSNVFGEIKRSPAMRMVGVSYIGIIDAGKIEILKETTNTLDSDWFPLDRIPELAFDHNGILNEALGTLRKQIVSSNILKSLFPNGFTLPELQKTYESILNVEYDRRNFRRKILSSGLIKDTNKYVTFEGTKPAKLYDFNNVIENKDVF